MGSKGNWDLGVLLKRWIRFSRFSHCWKKQQVGLRIRDIERPGEETGPRAHVGTPLPREGRSRYRAR